MVVVLLMITATWPAAVPDVILTQRIPRQPAAPPLPVIATQVPDFVESVSTLPSVLAPLLTVFVVAAAENVPESTTTLTGVPAPQAIVCVVEFVTVNVTEPPDFELKLGSNRATPGQFLDAPGEGVVVRPAARERPLPGQSRCTAS